MKIVYLGRASRRTNVLPDGTDDVLELLSNDWDDFGYKTSFIAACRISGKHVELGLIRLLVENEQNSKKFLDRLLQDGWNGEFPITNTNYLSVPSEITFYEQLMSALNPKEAIKAAKKLRDASYLVHSAEDHDAVSLVESEAFKHSLQRERGSQKAYVDGWMVLERQATAVLDLGFTFDDVCRGRSTLNLKYLPDGLLPHDVNALIGPNGVGKSRVLHQIVEDWTSPSKAGDRGFTKKPNLSQVVVVSYSPFERFPIDLHGKNLQDQEIYRYFGFRGRTGTSTTNGRGKIRLSHTFPKRNSASALIDCLSHDKKYGSIYGWAKKVETVETTLRTAFAFDYAAVQIDSSRKPQSLYHEQPYLDSLSIDYLDGDNQKCFIPISSDRIDELYDEKLRARALLEEGVTFLRNGIPVQLSSGQRLFAYVVINILGAIRRNSLILVDEPELFLHPTLEIQFVDLLKRILARFNSKALLATHSEVTVREIPARCVHVFEKSDEGLIIKNPPFQTFGGDVQRISSYVFGDSTVSKPFERWIRQMIRELGSGEALLEQLGDQVNEELVVQIQAMDRN